MRSKPVNRMVATRLVLVRTFMLLERSPPFGASGFMSAAKFHCHRAPKCYLGRSCFDDRRKIDMKTYDIALLGGDGTGPEVAAEGVKVAERGGQEIRLQDQLAQLRFRRRTLPEDRRNAAGQRGGRTPQVRRDLSRRRRPSRGQAGHPGKRHSAPPAFRAGPIHQSPPREALPRRRIARSRTRGRSTSTSSSSARTPRAFTPARAAFNTRARRTKSPSRNPSTPATASSAA